MITLQEQFEKDFPDKSVREIDASLKYKKSNFTNYGLDLREYKNLIKLNLNDNRLTSINLSGLKDLETLCLWSNNLTSVEFLNTLPNPEKLERIAFVSNHIRASLEVFSRFCNVRELLLGLSNKFYGSLKPLKNLTKLEKICIEATDVNEGLEYLTSSLVNSTKGGKYYCIECSPHNINAKCSQIQDQLRPFNYDIEAWQLAHPEKMLISRPEYFTNPDSKEKWIQALKTKLAESKQELSETEREKVKRIVRLESKIAQLEQTKQTISQQTQTEFSTQNKSTQTNLTMEQIKQWEQTDKNKTLYQKFVEKHGRK